MAIVATDGFSWTVTLTACCQSSEYGNSLDNVQAQVGPVRVGLRRTLGEWIAEAWTLKDDGGWWDWAELGVVGAVVSGTPKTTVFTVTTPGLSLSRGVGTSVRYTSEVAPVVLARERVCYDGWIVGGGNATISAGGFSRDLALVTAYLPVPFISASAEFTPSAVLSAHVAAQVSIVPHGGGGAASWEGVDGAYGDWFWGAGTAYSPGVETWNWSGADNALSLTQTPWPEGPGWVQANNEGLGFTEGPCPLGGSRTNWQSKMLSQFTSAGYAIDFTGLRVLRQQRDQSWDLDQPLELRDALIWGTPDFGQIGSGGFFRLEAMGLDWPTKDETEIAGEGEFAEGESLPLKLSDLLSLSDYTGADVRALQRVSTLSETPQTQWLVMPSFWRPPLEFHVDQKWLRDNNLLLVENTAGPDSTEPQLTCDNAMVIDACMWDQDDGKQDPWHSFSPVLADAISIDLSGAENERVTAWQGTDLEGGGIGSTGMMTIPCAAGSATTILREFASNFPAKYEWIFADWGAPLPAEQPRFDELPRFYWELGQNAPTCLEGAPWPKEDVCAWNYGYLRIRLDAPDSVKTSDVLGVEVVYQYIADVVDSHWTGTRRVIGDLELGVPPFQVSLSTPATLTWQVTGLVPGTNTAYICLMLPKTGVAFAPKLDLVNSLEFSLPAQDADGEWLLRDVSLVTDPTLSRSVPHLHHKFAEDYRHDIISSGSGKTGGYRGRIDCNPYGVTCDSFFNMWEVERVVPTVKWLLSEWANVFYDRLWTLKEYLVILSHVRNGVTYGLTDDEWTDWYAGGDGAACDLCPLMSATGDLAVANRCGTWVPAPGIAYKPRAIAILGGGIEGPVVQDGDFVRDTEDAVRLVRRGNAGESWQWVQNLRTDVHGFFEAGYHPEARTYQEIVVGPLDDPISYWASVNWLYGVEDVNYGVLFRRQLLLRAAGLPVDLIANLHAVEHFTKVPLVADCNLFALAGWSALRNGQPWNSRVTVPDSGDYNWANLCVDPSRQELLFEEDGALGVSQARGRNGPLSASTGLGAYSSPCGVLWHGSLYLTAYSGGNHYFLRREGHGEHAEKTAPVLIGAGDDQAAGLAVLPMTWAVLAAVPNAGNVELYASTDQGATWALVHTKTGLRYPALTVSANDSRFWLVGYADAPQDGATGSAVVCSFRYDGGSVTLLDTATVGGSDEGRSALLCKSTDWSLRVVAPKTTDWTAANATPGRAEYLSTDAGRTWALQAVHGET